MRIIADCGSSSCKWIVEGQTKRLLGPGINPSVMSQTEIRYGFESNQALFSGMETSAVQQVHFYGTGCLNEAVNKKVSDWLASLFPHAQVFVESDLFGACLAVYQHAPTAVGILGTGSAAAGFDGTRITRLTPSLGYQLADEGAGSDIGRRLILAFLYGEMPSELAHAFEHLFPATEPNSVIEKVYAQQAGSAFLAKHTQLAVDFPEHPFILNLVKEAFAVFIQRHMQPLRKAGFRRAGLLGSVAYGFQPILHELLLQAEFEQVEIIRDPLDALPGKIWK